MCNLTNLVFSLYMDLFKVQSRLYNSLHSEGHYIGQTRALMVDRKAIILAMRNVSGKTEQLDKRLPSIVHQSLTDHSESLW